MKNLKSSILLTAALVLISGCKEDFLETTPAEVVSDEQVGSSPAAAQGLISGIYASLRTFGIGGTTGHTDYGHMSAKIGSDMMAHDITMSFLHWYGFYHNLTGRLQTSTRTRLTWTTYYSQIAQCNLLINATDPATATDENLWLLGQAHALKGMMLLRLVQMYSSPYSQDPSALGIPIPDGADFLGKSRGTVQEAYDQIVSDLTAAVGYLSGFTRSSKQEVDLSVANGFLARAYLDMENWAGARDAALAARTGYTLAAYDGFSDLGNAEVMWGADIDAESSTVFASFFSHFGNTTPGYTGALGVYKMIDRALYDAIPVSDTRRDAFVDPVAGDPTGNGLPAYANIKFIDDTFFEGDYVYMRASEMYLIEAEARAMLGDATAANVLFELVSFRDPGYTLSTNTGNALREEIYLQRRIELWGEGVSYNDLKRLNKPMDRTYAGTNHAAFALLSYPANGIPSLWQLPEAEILANDNIPAVDQNARNEIKAFDLEEQ
ncbi:RagB/SusD family nutrient uptake outer membrane protein [Ekhidna sp.]|uniref:RagB/SusD family nutrient uptake outer membrane protein n=1 Tax=Ekhidna sp. TaxID=2608089 RepID=UPI003515A4A4